jgi:hypothetical protein
MREVERLKLKTCDESDSMPGWTLRLSAVSIRPFIRLVLKSAMLKWRPLQQQGAQSCDVSERDTFLEIRV